MRINPDELVEGYPARKIRKLLRHSIDFLWARDAMKILEIQKEKAIQLLKRLEKAGFLVRNPALRNLNDEQSWKRTVKGGALANALFSSPVSRQLAEKTLSEFLDRVRQVNSNSRFLYRIRKVLIFGSFLSDAPFLGDLDLAVDLCPKETDSYKHGDLVLARANEAASNGRRFSNFVDGLFFAEQEVIAFLKARSRILQLTRCDDGVLKIAESRVIYESPDPNPVVAVSPVSKKRVRPSKKRSEDLPF